MTSAASPARRRGIGLEHEPVDLHLALGRPVVIADDHPLLVRRGGHGHRPERERLEAPGVPGVRIAAGLAIGIELDRALDGDPAPARHGDADLERRVREPGERLRHEVLADAVLVKLLEQERQERRLRVVRAGQDVVGVEIAQVGEGVDHLVVELALRHVGEPEAEELEPLDGIDRVHRALQREVHVQVREHHFGLVDDRLALGGAERPGLGQELGQGQRRPDVRPPGAGRRGDGRPAG